MRRRTNCLMKWLHSKGRGGVVVPVLQWFAGLIVLAVLGWYVRRQGAPLDLMGETPVKPPRDIPVDFECRARRFNSWNPD